MVFLAAIFLGLIQGLTEFLPISSTAHLILLERFFHLAPENFGLTFDVVLHLGTLLALLLLFGRDLYRLVLGFCRQSLRKQRHFYEFRLVSYLILATLPAALFGFLFEEAVSITFRDPFLIALALLAGSAFFYLAEKMKTLSVVLAEIGWLRSLLLGLAQALALAPGISRSGITIGTGLLLGMRREEAAYFGFLMSVPIIFGAAAKKIFEVYRLGFPGSNLLLYLLGFLAAAFSGYLSIKYLLSFLKKHSLLLFICYRILLAVAILFAVK